MPEEVQIFTSHGLLRTDFSEDEIATLPEDRRERFFVLVEAATEKEKSEVELKNALADEAACAASLAKAVSADRLARPPRTFLEELRATINRPKEF